MKTVVAVVVYNRFRNLMDWIKDWQRCHTENAELVIIHNYRNLQDRNSYKALCMKNGIHYVQRENIGFDIGAFQDVCRGRLQGFPEDFDFLLWCTDDLFPMRKDFIQCFHAKFTDGVSAVCYELSQEIHPHIRTTGFMLRKETLPNITFKVDPVTTKPDCYDFEHRDKENSLIDQVARFGKVLQVDNIETSPMWDSGLNSRAARERRQRREREHIRAFK